MYDFCVITNMLKTIDAKRFEEVVKEAKGWDRKEFFVV